MLGIYCDYVPNSYSITLKLVQCRSAWKTDVFAVALSSQILFNSNR